jgi:plastocyanin
VAAQRLAVSGEVSIVKRKAGREKSGGERLADASNVVVWLTPVEPSAEVPPGAPRGAQGLRLTQQNKSFEPHLLAVQTGAEVQFPNKDPFFHNVFSLFNGKRFDLGLYEAGTSHTVHFDRAGVSFLFCNIHPEMTAIVVAVPTPYFAVSERSGRVTLRDVPAGSYRLHVWYERSSVEELRKLERVVTISESAHTLEAIELAENPQFTLSHKNKYGQDYVPPPVSPGYARP